MVPWTAEAWEAAPGDVVTSEDAARRRAEAEIERRSQAMVEGLGHAQFGRRDDE